MKYFITALFCYLSVVSFSQKKINTTTAQPKLVVGIVIDQMRWDYLQRFAPLFKPTGGFKRMLNNGFSCNNTLVPYTPTVTACGHTCVYTGSVPNIHGIVGNEWWDNKLNKIIYCTEDETVDGVGNVKGKNGKMSPENMFVTTICDELKLATNFKSKVIGIALKDRGAILPAGHSANAAFWYNKDNGNFISSTYYMQELPAWLNNLNSRKMVDSFYNLGWQLSLPNETYLQYCSADDEAYENKVFNTKQAVFPYLLNSFINKDYSKILTTPFGSLLTTAIAKQAIINEKMGKDDVTDFLTVSFSNPDYIGHSFGPNSWELLDCYIKLDEELGKFFDFLDKEIGTNNYLSFLTADHAVAHAPKYLKKHHLPNGLFEVKTVMQNLNAMLLEKYKTDSLVVAIHNYQISLNNNKINATNLDKEKICNSIINFLKNLNEVANAFMLKDLMLVPMNKTVREMLASGYNEQRSGEIQIILKPGYVENKWNDPTTHGLWNPYDAHIPLLFYGWNIKKGNTNRETYMTDIAATIAALLKIQMPSGCVGKVIEEVIKN